MRPIHAIAREIMHNWHKPYFGAVPYIRAMSTIDAIEDTYGADSAHSIIAYFLANAGAWRGETAPRVKKELNMMIKRGG